MDGLNWYLYCGGDPVNRKDPLGFHWVGGLPIEYPEDYDFDTDPYQAGLERAQKEMPAIDIDWNAVIDDIKETIGETIRRQEYYEYSRDYTAYKAYEQISPAIPQPLPPKIEAVKTTIDTMITTVKEFFGEPMTPEEFAQEIGYSRDNTVCGE